MNKPPCPVCRSSKQVQPVGVSGDMFRCGKCGGLFDNDSDEGGDYSDRNPSARLERQERSRASSKGR